MNIESILLQNEYVLYQGTGVPKKGSKSIIGILILLLIGLIPFLAGVKNLLIILPFFLVMALAVYMPIYNLFLKPRKVKGQIYYITNQRAIIYSSTNRKYKIGNLSKFDEFRVDNEKNNFGDVYMGIVKTSTGNAGEDLSTIKNTLFTPDKNDMPVIIFEGVEKPYEVLEIAKEQRIRNLVNRPLFNAIPEGGSAVNVGGQKVIVNKIPIWAWIVLLGLTIFFLVLPIRHIMNTLKIWNNYTVTTATVLNIEIKNANHLDEEEDIKYFVNVAYIFNSNYYESIITNDTCYLRTMQSDTVGTTHCRKFDNEFEKIQVNDELEIYVNPDNPTEIEFIPSLLPNSLLIILIFGLLLLFVLIVQVKAKLQNRNIKH